MSRRNFILLIIVLSIALVVFFSYLFLRDSGTPAGPGEDTNFGSDFNPFNNGSKKPNPDEPVDISGDDDTPVTPGLPTTGKLKKISSVPVAGFGLYMKERYKEVAPVQETTPTTPAKPTAPLTEFALALRYIDRVTGNVFQTFADKIEERKFTTTLIPQVYEGSVGGGGETVIMRYLKIDERTIATFIGGLPKEILGADTTSNNEVRGTFLPENVTSLSLSPDNLKIFYLFNQGDTAIGTTANIGGDKKVQVFDSPFTEWLSQWPKANMITLTTKPSALVPGYMYSIDPSKKDFTKVFGDINGLTTLTSPNGKEVLYSDNNLSLSVYRIDTRENQALGVRTMPEKCVWGSIEDTVYCFVPKSVPTASYPDSWYQGETSFNDQLWKIDASSGNATLLFDPGEAFEEVDGIKLQIDNGENYLFFVNKKDSFLWEYALK